MPERIVVAQTLGFCFGVSRAVRIAEQAAADGKQVSTWGPLAHNKLVSGRLRELGVRVASDLSDMETGQTVVIRSHGVAQRVEDLLRGQGLEVIDATCPCVAHIHKLVRDLEDGGHLVFILGEATHPEVQGIVGRCRKPVVLSDDRDLLDYFSNHESTRRTPVALVAQTTARHDVWEKCAKFLKKLCTNAEIVDTMCNATRLRQLEAKRLASQCDAMVVVGDKDSSNTRALAELCRSNCEHVLLIERAFDWPLGWLQDKKNVGLTAGASTPPWVIEEVYQTMSEEMKNQTIEQAEPAPAVEAAAAATELAQDFDGDESFEALLEKSFKTINTGDKVTGVVTAITPTEVHVDLGTKHAGYIPLEELSYEPDAKIEDLARVGEEIETYVMRVNDVEGTVVLSKRRLDTVKSWEDVELARESHVTMSGIVTEENKGGVVVSVKGVRVFVPASQTGLPKDAPMSSLLKQRVKVRVTEVNRARRRVVGSIRAVQMEERRGQFDEIWKNIEIGKHYDGVVKSLTSYGCFVDIGGVDGMVHVSELSWSRIKHPSDIVNVGDKIDVYVIGFDKEKKKISLGHKNPNENPWQQFIGAYQAGDTVNVRVVKLMPFGAFAEVIPGVDGLIHIGQIADRRINKPGDVLSEGQQVDVKITNIDMENRKISLSMRALLEPEVRPEQLADALLPDEVVAVSGDVVPEITADMADTTGETDSALETVPEEADVAKPELSPSEE